MEQLIYTRITAGGKKKEHKGEILCITSHLTSLVFSAVMYMCLHNYVASFGMMPVKLLWYGFQYGLLHLPKWLVCSEICAAAAVVLCWLVLLSLFTCASFFFLCTFLCSLI